MTSAQTLKDLITYCESKSLSEVAKGLKEQLNSQQNVRQADMLKIIKDALVREEKRQQKLEVQAKSKGGKDAPIK